MQALRSYCAANAFILDEKVIGSGRGGGKAKRQPVEDVADEADTEQDEANRVARAPKPAHPRQRKLEMRVDATARGDVAAALGRQTKSGRTVQHTRKARGED